MTISNLNPDSSIELVINNTAILGSQKDIYLYQNPTLPNSIATLFSGLSAATTSLGNVNSFGRFTFNVDSDIMGYILQVYDGVDTSNGHPCGDKSYHLSNSACDVPSSSVASPGLSLDLSQKELVAFEILSLDRPSGNNVIFRVWDNNGGTGYIEMNYPFEVNSTNKPIIILPFARFISPGTINWSNIRAIAVEFYSALASVDMIIGPMQFLSYNATKTVENPNNQPLTVSTHVPFKIEIQPDAFFSFTQPQINKTIVMQVNVTDTLPTTFTGVDVASIQVKDGSGNAIMYQLIDNNGVAFKLNLLFNNTQNAIITFNATTQSTFDFCAASFCNQASISANTYVPNMPSLVSQKSVNLSTCFELKSTPSLNSTLTTCPSNFSSTNLQYSAIICNNGNGLATNLVFKHTSGGALANCTPSFSNCVGNECDVSLDDLSVGQCTIVDYSFDCSAFANDCLVNDFDSSFIVTQSCTNTSTSSSCTFSSNPSLSINVTETLLNTTSAKLTEVISWNISATNIGPTNLKSYRLTKTFPTYTLPTNDTLNVWSCDVNNNVCVYVGSSLLSGESNVVVFSVVLLSNTPLGTSEVCGGVQMTSLPFLPNCDVESSDSSCAPVDPGTPDLNLQKVPFASQYTFNIDYENKGSGAINNLQLQEILQVGWSLNAALSTNGWTCSGTLCTFTVPSVAAFSSGSVSFVVDVEESSQTESNGDQKCWQNIVSSTFNDENYDPTPLNNQASVTIGSSCKECCDPAPCPTNTCDLECPTQDIKVPCPKVDCECTIPSYFCPPCQVNPPACNCAQCSNTP